MLPEAVRADGMSVQERVSAFCRAAKRQRTLRAEASRRRERRGGRFVDERSVRAKREAGQERVARGLVLAGSLRLDERLWTCSSPP